MGKQKTEDTTYFKVDEITVSVSGQHYTVQSWRCKDRPAILVVTPETGTSDPPDLRSSAIANDALRRLMGWSLDIPFYYYEITKIGGDHRVFNVAFKVVGKHSLRKVLASPSYRKVDFEALKSHLGEDFVV